MRWMLLGISAALIKRIVSTWSEDDPWWEMVLNIIGIAIISGLVLYGFLQMGE